MIERNKAEPCRIDVINIAERTSQIILLITNMYETRAKYIFSRLECLSCESMYDEIIGRMRLSSFRSWRVNIWKLKIKAARINNESR